MTLVTPLTVFADRAYRFDISDSSMSGTAFALSDVVNGIHGPGGDGTSAGTEYTTGKTTNGTAGSSGAYIQYDFTQDAALVSQLYFYENSGAGTSPANTFGGSIDSSILPLHTPTMRSMFMILREHGLAEVILSCIMELPIT